MRLATIISLGASAVLGLGALVVAKFWLPDDAKKKEAIELAPVVVAAKPITFGMKLDAKNLTVVKLPVDAVPVGSYRSVKDVIALDGGAPVALTAISPREAILPAKLSGAGARASVAAIITPGMRAYTIKVSDVAGGGGHVLPGDRVDVLLAREIDGEVEVDVVLQNVRILGINTNADQTSTSKSSPKHATLEVTVEDAGRLSAAARVGTLSVALRRVGATEVEPVRPIQTSDLRPFGPPVKRRAVPPPPPPPGYEEPMPVARQTPAPRPRTGGLVVVNGTTRSVANDGAGA